jgi:hypothetical protein
MWSRAVTERDFRRPEFLDAKPEDYEFDGDGRVVRKDRWETGIRRIVGILAEHRLGPGSRRQFEIAEVVDQVRTLASDNQEIRKCAYVLAMRVLQSDLVLDDVEIAARDGFVSGGVYCPDLIEL